MNTNKKLPKNYNSFEQRKADREWQKRRNNYDSLMTCIEYRGANDITVQFDESGYEVNTTWATFNKGSISSPYDKTVYGKAWLGEGKYKTFDDGEATYAYKLFWNMHKRCNSTSYQNVQPTYVGCSVCDEWNDFQVFADWVSQNFYDIPHDCRIELDKNVLDANNKVYCPEKCRFIPKPLNLILNVKRNGVGTLLAGVTLSASGKKYVAQITEYGQVMNLGTYETELEAHEAYRVEKQKYVRQRAEEYKEYLPSDIYDYLSNWVYDIEE